ncbi:hypothetical protein D3C73_1539870 [compost metagenome]
MAVEQHLPYSFIHTSGGAARRIGSILHGKTDEGAKLIDERALHINRGVRKLRT